MKKLWDHAVGVTDGKRLVIEQPRSQVRTEKLKETKVQQQKNLIEIGFRCGSTSCQLALSFIPTLTYAFVPSQLQHVTALPAGPVV